MKDRAYWQALATRYFDGETSREEEQQLKRFAASPAADGGEFDELRAVMGYVAVGRQLRHGRKRAGIGRRAAGWAAAAAIILGIITPLARTATEQDICIAYVGGQRVADSEQVMELMKQSMLKVQPESTAESVEARLNDIFQTMK